MNRTAKKLIDRLKRGHSLEKDEYAFLVRAQNSETAAYAAEKANAARHAVYGTDVYIRGLDRSRTTSAATTACTAASAAPTRTPTAIG